MSGVTTVDGARRVASDQPLSVFDMFTIGIGPSSSHTVGPMRAARTFVDELLGSSARSDGPGQAADHAGTNGTGTSAVGPGPAGSPSAAATPTIPVPTAPGLVGADVARVDVELFGSLGATGRGHGTDRAVLLGLVGHEPQSVATPVVETILDEVHAAGSLRLLDRVEIPFDLDHDVQFLPRTVLPFHPNGLRITASAADGSVLLRRTYFSVGGGFVVPDPDDTPVVTPADERSAEPGEQPAHGADRSADPGARPADPAAQPAGSGARPADGADLPSRTGAPGPITLIGTEGSSPAAPWTFTCADDLLAVCATSGLGVAEVMLANESATRTPERVASELLDIWQAMDACIDAGCAASGTLPGGLKVPRRAHALHRALLAEGANDDPLRAMDWVNLFALAVNEENAAGHRVVTAPTNGAAGIIPAVLRYYREFVPGADDAGTVRFLLAAGAVGIIIKTNASIAGAEVGCQGEVGSACAMAAAGLAEVLGGTALQVENAAEIAMEHNLGLTCDPIGGLVQIPCIERNAIGAVKAINAARMALRGDGRHTVSLDAAIETMRQTGADMHSKYKETSLGGLAVNYVEC
jgi:L-serine dehydratase